MPCNNLKFYFQRSSLSGSVTVTRAIDLQSLSEKIHFPADIPEHLCGDVYVLAVLDYMNDIIEPSEYNNVYAVQYHVQCLYGKQSSYS